MSPDQLHYLPLSPPFFSALVIVFFIVLVLLQIGALRYAYMRLGVSSSTALLLLFASLIGSYFNIPVAHLPAEQVVSGEEINFFGVDYVVPVVERWPGTVIAVNLGGCVLPTLMSIYLLVRHGLWLRGALAIAIVTIACHMMARPVHGLGIAIPVFVPAIITAIVAVILSRAYAAQLAYISGSLGTLIGADLLNLDKIQGLGAPIASIGGAGTFDGIFVTSVLAVLLASITLPAPRPAS